MNFVHKMVTPPPRPVFVNSLFRFLTVNFATKSNCDKTAKIITRAIRNSDVQQDWCYEPHICQYHTHQSILFWPKICHFEPLNFWIRVWKRADPPPRLWTKFIKPYYFLKDGFPKREDMWPVFLSSLIVLVQERNISDGIDPTEPSPNAASILTTQKTAAFQSNSWTSPESPSVDSDHPRSDWRTSPTMKRLSRSKPSQPSSTGAANPMSPISTSKGSTPTYSSSSSPLTRDSSSGGCPPPIGWSSLSPRSTSRERSSSPNSRPR